LERDLGPLLAAEEDYANRAYPASDIPFSATLKAQAAFNQVKARAGSMKAIGTWTLAGPSKADFPDILTFSGVPYTTSGRITALAIAPNCDTNNCRLWVAAAGGGIWRTDDALSLGSGPTWTFLSDRFGTNAIGTLTYDAASNTLYAGTGEPNASGDSEAGLGIWKSIDGGDTWTHLAANTTVPTMTTSCGHAPAYTGPAFNGRSISSILVDGRNNRTLYVGSTRGVRGVSSVTGGTVSLAPGLPPYGLWKSTDGGKTFTLLSAEGVCLNSTLEGDAGRIQATFGSARGVNHIEFDPSGSSTIYAAAFPRLTATGGGIWRSTDSGASWTQIKTSLSAANINDRTEFAVTKLGNGNTRMYVGDGNTGSPTARFYRTDDAAGAASFTDLTTTQNQDYCTGQCWYDNLVITPAGYPDTVYLGGSYQYDEYGGKSNSRALLYSTDAGASFTDVSWDAEANPTTRKLLPAQSDFTERHPPRPARACRVLQQPGTFLRGSDGGLVRSTGAFADIIAVHRPRSHRR
jgi:hypothetical protein